MLAKLELPALLSLAAPMPARQDEAGSRLGQLTSSEQPGMTLLAALPSFSPLTPFAASWTSSAIVAGAAGPCRSSRSISS